MRSVLIIFSCFISFRCYCGSWFASPMGTGTGTISSPMGLSNALNYASSPALPGDTIYLRGGTYTGAFVSDITGTSNAPIIVRSYPGEWAKIDCAGQSTSNSTSVLKIDGAYVWYWGFEVMNSNPDRLNVRNEGFTLMNAVGCKAINLIVHDNGDGIGNWIVATNSEVSGCIIYNNGWQAATNNDRGHGHGFYSQNANGMKVFRDNIVFNQFGEGMQVYGMSNPVWHYDIDNNVLFGNGTAATNQPIQDILLGGDIDDITLRNNIFYAGEGDPSLQWSWGDTTNGTSVVQRNLFIRGDFQFSYWTNLNVTSNTFVLSPFRGVKNCPSVPQETMVWDYNLYYSPNDWPIYDSVRGTSYHWSNWLSGFSYDVHSICVFSNPVSTAIYIRPNLYESNRANVVICNWSTNDNVSIDISSVIPVGFKYYARNAQDYFSSLVSEGLYQGGTISLPMTNLSVAHPIGQTFTPAATGPTFNTFVLIGEHPTTLNAGTIRSAQ